MTKLKAYFISGLLVLAPLFLTVIFLSYLIRLSDQLIVNPIFNLLPVSQVDRLWLELVTKICIAAVAVLLLCLIGFLTQKFLFRRVLETGDALLKNIPVFNKIYGSIRDIAEAFFGDKTGVFKRAVFVEYPRKGIWALGFVTQERPWALGEKVGKEIVSIFVPSPPNPATGMFVFVPKEDLVDAGVSVEEGIKMVLSGGAAVPGLKK